MAKVKETDTSENVIENEMASDLVVLEENNELKDLTILDKYDPFGEPDKNAIFYINGLPREWRAICSANGGFKIGEKGILSAELKMQVLMFIDYPQTILFPKTYQKNPVQDWLFVYFVDDENQLSSIFFKGRSRDNFIELLRGIAGKGKSVASQIITCYMNDKTSSIEENGKSVNVTFNIVNFRIEDNTEEKVTNLKNFWLAQQNGKSIFSNFLNEIIEESEFVRGQKKDVVLVDEETGELVQI